MNFLATVSFDTQQILKPTGTPPAAGYMVWMTRDNVTTEMKQLSETERTAVFNIVQAGTYVARVVRADINGASIGNAAESTPFVVNEEMVDVPLTVTVSIPVEVPNTVVVR